MEHFAQLTIQYQTALHAQVIEIRLMVIYLNGNGCCSFHPI